MLYSLRQDLLYTLSAFLCPKLLDTLLFLSLNGMDPQFLYYFSQKETASEPINYNKIIPRY